MDLSEFFLVTTEIQIDYAIKSSVVFYGENCIFLVPFQICGNFNIIKYKISLAVLINFMLLMWTVCTLPAAGKNKIMKTRMLLAIWWNKGC